MSSAKMWFECSPSFVVCIFSITFLEAYIVPSFFVNTILYQVYILLVGVSIEICIIYISQLLNFVENSIDWCVKIKSHLFDNIITLGKHLKCNFAIGIEEMLEDDVDGILDGVVIVIAQGSDLIRANSCDYFLP